MMQVRLEEARHSIKSTVLWICREHLLFTSFRMRSCCNKAAAVTRVLACSKNTRTDTVG